LGFTAAEREKFHLRGLLPPSIEDIDQQHKRAISQMREFETSIQKYIYITSLQQRNETLFYHTLLKNMEEILPIIYTPTGKKEKEKERKRKRERESERAKEREKER